MATAKKGQGQRQSRSPRAENADVVERHGGNGIPRAAKASAADSARSTKSGRNDTRKADPDMPDESRARGHGKSQLREGRHASASQGQGVGAGARRRAGKRDSE
jgi:hypothetical protein